MLELKDFRILPNNKWIKLNVSVNPDCRHTTGSTYDGVYINKIKMSIKGDFLDTIMYPLISEALTNAGIAHTPTSDFTTNGITITGTGVTDININIEKDAIDKPFFLEMYVVNPSPTTLCTTCAYNTQLKAVTFNKLPLYEALVCAAKKMNGCEPPREFINYLLQLKALESAINIGDNTKILEYFNLLQEIDTEVIISNTPCGCH